jgi:hypothetical protein
VAPRGRTDASDVFCQTNQGQDWIRGHAQKSAGARENVKTDIHLVPTSVDSYTVGALKEWFNDRDPATDLQLSLNKYRLASLVSNFCDHTKLGFKGAGALEKAHKVVNLRVMAVKAYSRTQAKFWYVVFNIISHADRCKIQMPV